MSSGEVYALWKLVDRKEDFKVTHEEVSAQDIPTSAMQCNGAIQGYVGLYAMWKVGDQKKEFRMRYERCSLRLFLYQQ